MSEPKVIRALKDLCAAMQETDANELVIEMGLHGGSADGTRYLVHIIRQCPEEAVEEEDEDTNRL